RPSLALASIASIVALFGGAVVASSACSPAVTTQPPAPKPIASNAAYVAPPPDHPARWVLHPATPSPLHARVDLGNVGVLYAGDDGERWLDHGGTPVAATSLLPESIAVVGRTAESFPFVAAKGAALVVASSHPPRPPLATPP